MPRKRTPESGVLRACLDLLAAERIWVERRNTGAFKDGKRFVRFGRPGTPDIQALMKAHYCSNGQFHRVIWIECKAPNGRQTRAQMEFQREAEADGHKYLLIRDVAELKNWLAVTR